MATTPRLSELERRLLQAPEPGVFTDAELNGLPEPAWRHLALLAWDRWPYRTLSGPHVGEPLPTEGPAEANRRPSRYPAGSG